MTTAFTLRREARQGSCASCIAFRNDPADIEQDLPGLTVFCSAHASIRGNDGLCMRHDRITSANGWCADRSERGERAR